MSATVASLAVVAGLALQPVIAATAARLWPPVAARGVIPPELCSCGKPLTPGHTCTNYTTKESQQ
ncbi:hypothetical protein [Streptomyces sp. NPDC020983]|uniref:hypothetical protein n=1 Tax=Streptomyces sp. NPDC020983 TaxID=3365106 RepID=UPI0037B34D5B